MKQLKSWQRKVYVQSSALLLLGKYRLRFGIWPPRLLAMCKTIYHWSEAVCQMDKSLQTELRLSDVSHFCLCLAKSWGWDLVEGTVNGKWNMESVAGSQGEACNAGSTCLLHRFVIRYKQHQQCLLYSYGLSPKLIAV